MKSKKQDADKEQLQEQEVEQVEAEEQAQDEVVDEGDLSAQIENYEAQVAELKEQVLRYHAEAENVRRRADADVTKARQFSIKSFAESLIPVKDSLEAALNQKEQTVETMTQGVETTLKQLNSAFGQNNLKEIAPEAGEKFDPNLHQAISSVPNPDVANNCVIETMQKGYAIGDRVIRAAMVVVSAG